MFQLLLLIIYLAFISLGLPDALLGSAWPTMSKEFSMPLSYAGIISMIISVGTIISSLQSDRVTRKFGTGKVTAVSVMLTAVALFGFSFSRSFWQLCLWAVPYGLGAGSVDASLNNYVAIHYSSRHMSWLHCMWGIGASLGPYIMSFILLRGQVWNSGYRAIGILQVILTVLIFLSLPLWSKNVSQNSDIGEMATTKEPLSLREVVKIPGVKEVMTAFFCYCALELSVGLWVSSYFVLYHKMSVETAAGYAALFYIGITVGRAVSGFLTIAFNDTKMIRLGQGVILLGIAFFVLPFGNTTALFGLILIGLGCAPIYPCIIHSTPKHFGANRSQAIIGIQMASAYIGSCIMPSIFGIIADYINISLFPVYLFGLLVLMIVMHEKLLIKCKKETL